MGVEGQVGDGCNIAPIPLWGQVSGNHLFFLRLYTQWAFSKWRFKAFLDLFYWKRTPKRPHESAMASMAKQHRQRGIHVSTDFHQDFQGRKSEVKTSPALVSSKASPLGLLFLPVPYVILPCMFVFQLILLIKIPIILD